MKCYEIIDPRNGKVIYVGIGDKYRILEPKRNAAVNNRIDEIHAAGFKEIRNELFDMTPDECRVWEFREIEMRGLEKDGGTLLNISRGTTKPTGKYLLDVTAHDGTRSKASTACDFIKQSISEILAANPQGLRNADISKTLGFEFPGQDGQHKDYVTHSILHAWVREGKVTKEGHLFFRKLT